MINNEFETDINKKMMFLIEIELFEHVFMSKRLLFLEIKIFTKISIVFFMQFVH